MISCHRSGVLKQKSCVHLPGRAGCGSRLIPRHWWLEANFSPWWSAVDWRALLAPSAVFGSIQGFGFVGKVDLVQTVGRKASIALETAVVFVVLDKD